MIKKTLSEEAAFLLKSKGLTVTGNPDLAKLKGDLENEIGRKITLTITKQEGNYIEATFTL
ncbi:MAG: hypothetical protein H7068_05845 [Pedobacter sp.]|nr:hypothetical protein [Chitinophagaceae bacterium]